MRSFALVAVAILGCSSHDSTPAKPLLNTAVATPQEVAVTSTEPIELLVTEGTPATLSDGVTVNVKGVGYLHLSDSKNVSQATAIVVRGGVPIELPMARLHGEDKPDEWKPAHGWEFKLDYSDPYHQPSTVKLLVRKAH